MIPLHNRMVTLCAAGAVVAMSFTHAVHGQQTFVSPAWIERECPSDQYEFSRCSCYVSTLWTSLDDQQKGNLQTIFTLKFGAFERNLVDYVGNPAVMLPAAQTRA